MLVLPRFLTRYQLNLVVSMVVYALFAVSYNILYGYGGFLSFGHAAYFGGGAYALILLLKYTQLPFPLCILLGGIFGGLLGLAFGVFIVRLGGTYFALLTLAFNQLVYAIAEKWRTVTGGEDGLYCLRPNLHLPLIGEVDLFSISHWYYFVLLVVGICLLASWHFTRTPLGRVNVYIRENEKRAQFIGFNTYFSKLMIYTVSCFMAGIAGSLAAASQEFVSVTYINLDKSAEVLIMTFIGGGKVFWGPIFGAGFLTFLNNWLSTLTERWVIIQGFLFVILVLFAPWGVSGIFTSIREKFSGGGKLGGEEA